MNFDSKFWLKFSLINLLIVALLGLLMRYKIGFEFPYFNQKNLQHSHSHFAFLGWVSHTIMVLMIAYLRKKNTSSDLKIFNSILTANLICSYGMLISFIIEGYGFFSIAFSTISLFISYVFGYFYFKHLKLQPTVELTHKWFKAAVFFNIISSLGTFFLAYMMATKNIHEQEYLASIYYYLHFQYNGWFFFACMGLLYGFLDLQKKEHKFYDTGFKLFFLSCIPAYFLSTLWANLPMWLYAITVIAAFTQVFAWYKFLIIIVNSKKEFFTNFPYFLRYILFFVGFSVSVKVLLQLGSTIPSLSKLAFGFRPIVIAYLHLVLLAIVTLFLLFYIYSNHLIHSNKKIKLGVIIFSIGVFLNEIILAVQGIAAFSYTMIPYVNELLFGAAVILVSGIGLIAFYSIKKVKISINL